MLAQIHVDGRDATPGWLGQWNAVEVGRFPVWAPVFHLGLRIVHCLQPIHPRNIIGEAVVVTGFRIEGAGVPVRRSPGTRQGKRALVAAGLVADDRRWREDRADHEIGHCGASDLADLRIVDDVLQGNALCGNGCWLGREGLCSRKLLTGHIRLRHG